MRNLSQIWASTGRKLILSGLRAGTQSDGKPIIVRSSEDIANALRTAWSPVFAFKDFTNENGRAVIDE